MRKHLTELALAIVCFMLALGLVYKSHQIKKLDERIESLETAITMISRTQNNVTGFQDEQVKFNTAVLSMFSDGTWESR